MRIRFRVLGPVEIEGGADAATVPVGGPKQQVLLVMLLLNANRPVSHERLTEALWNGDPPRSATANLHTYAARLRHALGRTDSGAERLVTRPGQYLLQVEPGELDLRVFEDLAGQARAALARGEFLGTAHLAGQALALWRGPAADRVPRMPVLAAHLEALDEQRLALLEDQFDARLALGKHAAVVTPLRELVAEHPLRERAWGQLMLALYRGGDVAAALTAFHTARAALSDHLGIEPGAELTRLQQAILNRDPSLGSSFQNSPAVGQAVRAGQDATGWPQGPPRQLPRDVALVGRLQERHALLGLAAADCRGVLAAIHGAGGVGKTALAVHAAHILAQRFPDGQLYVDLRGACPDLPPLDPAAALARMLRALGVPAAEVPHALLEAAAAFRSLAAGRRFLIMLDNAADAAQVQPLLPAGPGCLTIVTSRCRLPTLEGAAHLELDVLPLPEAVDLLGQHAGAARVAAEPDAAAEVARLCDHLPLALRTAGARLASRPHWQIADFAARLADERRRLDELEVGELSVRSCIQAGYGPLSTSTDPTDQLAERAFRHLGAANVPDISPAAVAGALGVTERSAEEALDRLVDLRLLTQAALGHYRLNELARLFAAEQAVPLVPGPASVSASSLAATPTRGRRMRPRCGGP